jgi:hypothetical protein
MGQEHVDRWLTTLGYGRMAAALREEALGDDARGGSWVTWIVGKLQLSVQV